MIEYRCARWQDTFDATWTEDAELVICDPFYESQDLSYINVAARVLRSGGSLYVFADSTSVAQTKLALDHSGLVFQNWLIWGPNDWGGRSKRRWGQKHDDILFYTKKGAPHTFNGEDVGVPKKMTQAAFNPSGRTMKIPNSVWDDLSGFSTLSSERVKIDGKVAPWQKPEAVIKRIVLASSNFGDTVVDFFSGVATVPAVCRPLGRHCVATEENPVTHAAGLGRLGNGRGSYSGE